MISAVSLLEQHTEQHTGRQARAPEIVRLSRFLVGERRHLVAASRLRLRSRRAIAGGSIDEFHDGIRARLAAKTLLRIDPHAWIEDAGGQHRCACCDMMILEWQPEYEPMAAAGSYAHAKCFMTWLAESAFQDLIGASPKRADSAAD